MGAVIRQADLDRDRDALIRTHQRYLNPLADSRRYDWLYRDSPFGQALTWLAVDGEGEIVGSAALFPRVVFIHGEQRLGGVLGDFCISERHRSLGPALQLQKQCLCAVRSGEYSFCYDFPSSIMAGIYHRLGMKETHRMLRLSRPLDLAQRLRGSRWSSALLAPTLGRCANVFLRHQDRPLPGSFRFQEHSEAFDQEFTALAYELAPEHGVHTFRSAAYLNWRYRNHPARSYQVITARTASTQLAGYLIFSLDQHSASIADLCCREDAMLLQGLVQSAVSQARSAGAASLSFPLLESSRWIPLLRAMGFLPRESSPLVTYARAESAQSVMPELLLLAGDRES